MKKEDVIHFILGERIHQTAKHLSVESFAPTNIALCKYWGKRDTELNLPMTSSLSIGLAKKGTTTFLKMVDDAEDRVFFNGDAMPLSSPFSQRLLTFLDLFRTQQREHFHIEFTSNIPLAAGLASSASGFASFVLALNHLYDWQLSFEALSILARLGSGSACRSLWNGFVEWKKGNTTDGMDSHGVALKDEWPELCVGLLIVNRNKKAISSREAMERTKNTSTLYSLWPAKVNHDLVVLKEAIMHRDFSLLGKTAESNAMTMHAMMLSAWPSVSYYQPETIEAMQRIWTLRQDGLPLYFTQDAGPNLKLLFLKKEMSVIQSEFKQIEVIDVFAR
jgi:diphosphomevalonate decarboxylase